ncbi:MAG: STAS domain-containing protein [Planctomycetota bacterium]|jgi:anti-sigma B factor antagonist
MQDKDSSPSEIIKEIRREGQAVILVLAGEIDMKSSIKLRNEFLELLREKPSVLIVNMTQVEFMDSSGIGTLVEVLRWSRRNGGQLKLAGLAQGVRNIFEISRLDAVFQIYDTEAEALS